jgi:hypothetical protein
VGSRRCVHINTEPLLLHEAFRERAVVDPLGEVRPEEVGVDTAEVGFAHKGFEDFGLNDEEVAELTEHGEAVVKRREGEGSDGVLVEGKVPVEIQERSYQKQFAGNARNAERRREMRGAHLVNINAPVTLTGNFLRWSSRALCLIYLI